jgi:thiamine biosynthesis lipoprotein
MKTVLHSLLLIIGLTLLSACGDTDRALQAKFYAFGTEIDVSLYGVDEEAAAKTIDALEQSFSDVNDLWHAWQPSVLTKINDAIAAGEPIAVDEKVASVILLAQTLARESGQLFNPAAGNLFKLWGYEQDNWFESRPPPAQDDIDAWLADSPTMEDIQIENGLLTSNNTNVRLGFGGFAKGYAVDNAIAILQQQGIQHAVVNIGGDLRAIGKHGERPWIIGIRHPRHDRVLASVAVSDDESVFSSGDYERFFIYEGKRYPHILDPRTGYPADQAMSSTVIHENASLADAAATAIFVAGRDWPTVAADMGLNMVMLVTADGEVEMSPAMQQRVRLTGHDREPIIRDIPQE